MTIPSLPDLERRTTYNPAASAGPFDVGFAIYGDGTDYDSWVRVYLDGVELFAGADWTMDSASGPFATIARPIIDARITLAAAATGRLEIIGQMRPRRTSQLVEGRGVSARDFNLLATKLIAVAREYFDRIRRAEDQIATQIVDPTIASKAVRVDIVQTFSPDEQSRGLSNLSAGGAVWSALHRFSGGLWGGLTALGRGVSAFSTEGYEVLVKGQSGTPPFGVMTGDGTLGLGVNDDATIDTDLGTGAVVATGGRLSTVSRRIVATADIVLNVNVSTGDDATGDGSSGNPFKTPGGAYAYAQKAYDLAGQFKITARCTGAFDSVSAPGGNAFYGPITGAHGAQSFIVQGDVNDNSAVTFHYTGLNDRIFQGFDGAQFCVEYCDLSSSGALGMCIVAASGAQIRHANNRYGACYKRIYADVGGSRVDDYGPNEIYGDQGYSLNAETCATVSELYSVTLTNSPHFAHAYAQADYGGVVLAVLNPGQSYINKETATGVQAIVNTGGIIGTNETDDSHFPGDGGVLRGGGYYIGGDGSENPVIWCYEDPVSPIEFDAAARTIKISGLSGGVSAGASGGFTRTPTLGVIGASVGSLALAGGINGGYVAVNPSTAAYTGYNFNLPAGRVANGYLLTDQGNSSDMTWTSPSQTLGSTVITLGGTVTSVSGLTLASPTLSGTVAGDNTVPLSILQQQQAGTALGNFGTSTANVGAGSAVSLGLNGSYEGSLTLKGSTSGSKRLKPQAAAGSGDLTLPTVAGTLVASAASPLSINIVTGEVSVAGSALTKTDDTNVTLTLGGSASSALLAAASLTLGWTGQLAAGRGGTGSAFFGVSGPASTVKTFTFPNANATVLTDNAAVTAAQGGTGISSYTAGDLLYASGASALSKLADVAIGSVLVSGGVGVAPAYSASPQLTSIGLGVAPTGGVSLNVQNGAGATNAIRLLSGGASTFVGYSIGTNADKGNWAVAGGANDFMTGTASGDMVFNSSANKIFFGAQSTPAIVVDNGPVAFPNISTTASAANAFLDNASSNNLLRSTSSSIYKRRITELSDDDEAVLDALRPVKYQSGAAADDPQRWHIGLVAEEVAAADERFAHFTVRDGAMAPDSVQYDRLVMPVIRRLNRLNGQSKEQDKQISELTAQLAAVREQLADMASRLPH